MAAAIFDFTERDDFERPRAISDAAHQVLVEAFHTTRYDLFIRTFSFGKTSPRRASALHNDIDATTRRER
ncbi:hypothetical protein LGM59_32600 [Burkholderia metallica]|nr:hypothetical protein [Burkholderia metallica]MCA8002999.1 hypothetical protein [Burkholderia metallica]